MAQTIIEGYLRKNITATDNSIGTGINAPFFLLGIMVAQASSTPTLKVADQSGNIMNTITPAAGTWYPLPCQIQGQLNITISGTVDCTVFYGSNAQI